MSSLSEQLSENMALRSQMNKKKTTSSSSSSSTPSPKPKPKPKAPEKKKKPGLMSKIFGKKSEDLNLSERLLLSLAESQEIEEAED